MLRDDFQLKAPETLPYDGTYTDAKGSSCHDGCRVGVRAYRGTGSNQPWTPGSRVGMLAFDVSLKLIED